MQFQTQLVPARLIKRYKRFLADVRLADGQIVTAHCANPGSMLGLAMPEVNVWVEPNEDPKKKLKFAWRLIECDDGTMINVDTSAANRVIKEALENRALPLQYDTFRAEVKYAENSRIDFLLFGPDGVQTFVEVKSVTLSRTQGIAEFPDSVTARGTKHLGALADQCAQGHRALILYLVNRTDCQVVTTAGDIDPKYALAMGDATKKGVEVLCFDTHITAQGMTLGKALPYQPFAAKTA